ncbi:MAG: site-2 protease family protein [Chloroflexi bacterium]|nr:site-2 protease family protein [Chloroflexota bacterium]
MWRDGIPIGKAFGIALKLNYSWFIVFGLVTWSLAAFYFPLTYPTWSTATSIIAGVVTSLLLFGSVMAHELSHSVVAQSTGIVIHSIVLFIFGGVSQMSDEPKKPKDEFRIAIAGPLSSIVIGGIFFGIRLLFNSPGNVVGAIASQLSVINIFLALFNLIPGFPLDGGRVLRSILWGRNNNLRQATKTASNIGRGVGYLFIFAGVYVIFGGTIPLFGGIVIRGLINGLWFAFIGWFLENAAVGSYRQLALRDMLRGHTVKEVMTQECPLVAPDTTIEKLVNEQILATGRRCFPVAEDNRSLGLITLHNVKSVPREQWGRTRVREAMTPFENLKWVRPDQDLDSVLALLADADVNQVPVVEDHKIVGMVARDKLLAFINVRSELGG